MKQLNKGVKGGKRISSGEVKLIQSGMKHDDWHEGIDWVRIAQIKRANYRKRYWPKGRSYLVFGLFNERYMISKKAWDECEFRLSAVGDKAVSQDEPSKNAPPNPIKIGDEDE